MARGRRCDNGCESWPPHKMFKECPICGEPTTLYKNLKPLKMPEALDRAFELFYATWDAERDPHRLDADAPNAAGRFAVQERLPVAPLAPSADSSG